MMNSISEYFWGSGDASSDPVEMKSMDNLSSKTEQEVTSPPDPLAGLKNSITPSPLGVTQSVTYADFYPKCLQFSPNEGYTDFEPFSTVLDQANDWLAANPQFRLMKCESIRKRIMDGPKIEFDSVLQHESSNGKNYFLNGLRLWLRGRQASDPEPAQQLGCRHSVPWLAVDSDDLQTHQGKLYPSQFLSLQQKVECINASFKQRPLPGSILTVESVFLRSSDALELPGWSPERSCWLEDGRQKIHSVTIFRVFYVLGEPKDIVESIGVEDFLPKITKEAMSFASKPHFQSFSEVLKCAKAWLKGNKQVRVVNIQSSFTKVEQKNTGKATSLRHLMTHTESENDISLYLKLLTIFYVKQLKVEKLSRVELKTLNVQPSSSPVTNISNSVTVHKPQAVSYTEVVTSSDDAITKEMASSGLTSSSSSAVTSSELASSVNECFPAPIDIPCLTCKLFAPLRRGPKTFESFSRTVDRASYWIKCNKSPLLFLESTSTLFSENMYGNGVKEGAVLFEINRQLGRYFLTSVWGYFADRTEELVMEEVSNPYVKVGEVTADTADSGVL
ncbi:uncharacterized protein LOC135480719 [Liolophura sinensis]|uniref:uncharacterized protein LOC135480719 n=1 Tax=Liolophura sinensis TaxID=3198878 RepID=UPI0031580A06